jgi:hypothetical protein
MEILMVDASDTRLLLTPVEQLRPYGQNARTHSQDQIEQIANSILEFGFTNPVLIDRDGVILAGHARLEAANIFERTTSPQATLEGGRSFSAMGKLRRVETAR